MPCIKYRASLPHLCTGTIVNKAIVPDSEIFRMETALATINRVAREFVATHGLQAMGFHDYIRICFGKAASPELRAA